MDILVADDDHVSRVYLELALTSLGHSVTVAENGAEALQLLDQFMFDAVLLDVEMPLMGGVETLANIRANPAFQTLRVYAITAHTHAPMLEAIQQAGFAGYLTKPYGPGELKRLLSEKDDHHPEPSNGQVPLLDREVFLGYQKLLREAGMSPRAEINRTLETLASWLAVQTDDVTSREQLNGMAGDCAIIGASALREAMKTLERLVIAGDSRRWTQALVDAETLFQKTRSVYRASLSGVDSDLKQ